MKIWKSCLSDNKVFTMFGTLVEAFWIEFQDQLLAAAKLSG
jgi:hypothetical protein